MNMVSGHSRGRALVAVALAVSLLATGCGSDDGVSCGEGTKKKGDVCVVDGGGDGTTDLTRPVLDAVKLTKLAIAEEGLRPLYALHPVHVDVELALRGEAFESMVVVGLDSGDGTKSCVLGTLTTTFAGSPAAESADAQPADDVLAVSGELYVQPECAEMAGDKAATAWVSFDPFLRTTVATLPSPALDPLVKDAPDAKTLIKARRLSLDGCKAGAASPHPDTCKTAIEVAASPGIDLEMAEATLSSSVAIFHHVIQPNLTAPAAKDVEPGVEIVAPKIEDFVAPVPTSPHFTIATRLRLLGVAGEADDPLADKDLKLSFALRPAASELPANSTMTVDWSPLYAEVSKLGKAGEATFEKLEAEFLESIVGSTEHIKDSPIYIIKETAKLLDTEWRTFQQFELRACADPGIAEGGVEPDAKANNCETFPVIIVHRDTPMVPKGSLNVAPDQGAAGAALEKNILLGFDEYSGTSGQLRLHAFGGSEFFVTQPSSYSFRKSGVELSVSGWFSWSLYDIYKKTKLKLSPLTGQIEERFVLYNITTYNNTGPYSLGVTVKGELSKGKDFKVSRTYGIPHFADVTLSIGVEIAAKIEASIFAGLQLPMVDCESDGITVGDKCFYTPRSSTDPTTAAKYSRSNGEKWCKDRLGRLAEPQNGSQNTAAVDALKAAKASSGWIGAYQRRHFSANKDSVYDDDVCEADYITPPLPPFFPAPAYHDLDKFVICVGEERRWRWPSGDSWQSNLARWATDFPAHEEEPGYFERAAYLSTSDAKWRNSNTGTSRPVVCEFTTADMIKLSATIKPGVSVNLFGELKAEAAGFQAIVRASIELITIAFPVTGALIFEQLSTELQVTPSLTGDIVLTTLGGDIKWWVKVWDVFNGKYAGGWDGTLYKWSGFTAASWKVFRVDDIWHLK